MRSNVNSSSFKFLRSNFLIFDSITQSAYILYLHFTEVDISLLVLSEYLLKSTTGKGAITVRPDLLSLYDSDNDGNKFTSKSVLLSLCEYRHLKTAQEPLKWDKHIGVLSRIWSSNVDLGGWRP